MEITQLFDLIQALAISIFVMLAIYLACFRSTFKILGPFVFIALIEAFFSYTYFLLAMQQGEPTGIPTLLRLRWAVLALLPGLFLQIFSFLVRGKRQRFALYTTYAAYILGIATGGAAFFERSWIIGIILPMPTEARLLDPIFHPTGVLIILTWVALAISLACSLLAVASRDASRTTLQTASRRLIPGWSVFILAAILGAIAIGLSGQIRPELSLILRMIERLLAMAAAILLARGILQMASPIRRRFRSIHLFGLFSAAAIALASPLFPSDGNAFLALLRPLPYASIGLIAGVLLAHPELLQRLTLLLGSPPQDETSFAIRLHRAWLNLAEGSFSIAQMAEMLLTLQEQMRAEYVGMLELMQVDESRRLTFGRWEDGPRFHIKAHHVDWPITEETLHHCDYQTSNLPGQPSIILPIHDEQDLAGILLIGKSLGGHFYSAGALRLAELLAEQLSFAIGHGLRLEEAVGMPRKVQAAPPFLPKVNIAIRTFGRLEIYTQHGEAQVAPPSKRAHQILALLLASYPDPLPAETLMEHLWPEQPLGAAANSLYVAIYALRRILEPDLHRGAVSRYIRRESDWYRLVLDDDFWVDFLEFERLYQQGREYIQREETRAAMQVCERALRLYRRPFLTDASLDLPAEVEVTRHRLQSHLHEVAKYITQECLKQQDWPRAERALLQLLAVDPQDHAARIELANIYRTQGKEGLAQELEAQGASTEA
jgi:DNA-binding SARP family transcriptional activator/GAF domain-containing protein